MAATAEAPVAEVAATTTTATKQAPSSKQAEEPVPVVSSLASVYPDGNRKKMRDSVSFCLSELAACVLFCFVFCGSSTTSTSLISRSEEGNTQKCGDPSCTALGRAQETSLASIAISTKLTHAGLLLSSPPEFDPIPDTAAAEERYAKIRAAFVDAFKGEPEVFARAPGEFFFAIV